MGHAEKILEILAREEQKRAIRARAKQDMAPLVERTLHNLEQSEKLLEQAQKIRGSIAQLVEASASRAEG